MCTCLKIDWPAFLSKLCRGLVLLKCVTGQSLIFRSIKSCTRYRCYRSLTLASKKRKAPPVMMVNSCPIIFSVGKLFVTSIWFRSSAGNPVRLSRFRGSKCSWFPPDQVATMQSKRTRAQWVRSPLALSQRQAQLLLMWGVPLIMPLGMINMINNIQYMRACMHFKLSFSVSLHFMFSPYK